MNVIIKVIRVITTLLLFEELSLRQRGKINNFNYPFD